MILKAWTTDSTGHTVDTGDEWCEVVSDRKAATALIAGNLSETASDGFLHDALEQWFKNGKIEKLHEGPNMFWNLKLDENESAE